MTTSTQNSKATGWFFCNVTNRQIVTGFGTFAARRLADGSFEVYADGSKNVQILTEEQAKGALKSERVAGGKVFYLNASERADVERRAHISSN